MENPTPLSPVVATPSPLPSLLADVPLSLQALIYQSVSAALAQAGITAPTLQPVQEAIVAKELAMTKDEAANHPLPILTPSKRERKVNLGPHLRVHYRKGNPDGYVFVWPGRRQKGGDRLYGRDPEELRVKARNAMVEAIDSGDGEFPISKGGRVLFNQLMKKIDEKNASLEAAGLSEKKLTEDVIWAAAMDGIKLHFAVIDYNLKSSPSNLADHGIKEGIREILTIGQSIINRKRRIKKKADDSLSCDNGQNDNSILNRLEAEFKKDTPVMEMLMAPDRITNFFNREIHSGKNEAITRQKEYDALDVYFTQLCTVERLFLIDRSIMGNRPTFKKKPVVVPRAAIVRKFLELVRTMRPDLLLFALLQFLCGLRPQEAYKAIQEPRKYILSNRIWVPAGEGGIAKKQCIKDRDIRLRPLFDVLLAFVPGWGDPLASFVPEEDGKKLTWNAMQTILGDLLKKAGWVGKMPRECGRKCFISACVACFGNDKKKLMHLIIDEAGHTTEDTIKRWYDGGWDIQEGLDYFSMFPACIQNPPTKNLHQCFGQDLEP
jgi:hypothetical protein